MIFEKDQSLLFMLLFISLVYIALLKLCISSSLVLRFKFKLSLPPLPRKVLLDSLCNL